MPGIKVVSIDVDSFLIPPTLIEVSSKAIQFNILLNQLWSQRSQVDQLQRVTSFLPQTSVNDMSLEKGQHVERL
ncbi:hypothetical protein DICVIV_08532 [Dictyocaulus viviparus]|uniref:Uncharacterized protein n=1 Tax=Dictyocaulus viviparus TaxID=29172 RepID=A0A0D8XLA0_DICVI|nr:hypothetical protein DICVIV_08532 [Dictyocaulus viviparus]